MLRILYFVLGILSLAAFAGGPALAHFEVASPMVGFAIFALGCLLGAVVFLIGIGIVVRQGPGIELGAAAMGLIPAAFLVYSLVRASQFPAINDVSTEKLYPPEFVEAGKIAENAGRDMGFADSLRPVLEEHYPDIKPVAIEGDPEDIFLEASRIAREQPGWTGTRSTFGTEESAIEGYAVTSVFRFCDDFVIRVTKANGGAVVDMRSKSRDGKGDFGANAQRIREFMGQLGAAMGV